MFSDIVRLIAFRSSAKVIRTPRCIPKILYASPGDSRRSLQSHMGLREARDEFKCFLVGLSCPPTEGLTLKPSYRTSFEQSGPNMGSTVK